MFPGVPLVLAFPITAEAPEVLNPCPGDPCDYLGYDIWTELEPYNATKIPSDGVLVLQGVQPGWPGITPDLDRLSIVVTRDGQPTAGALETTRLYGVLVWRPTEAWVPGATYEYELMVSNGTLAELQGCAPEMLQRSGEIVIDEAPASGLVKPMLTATAEVELSPWINVQDLACCEGAEVSVDEWGCYDPVYDPDECASTRAYGQLAIELRATPASSGPGADQLIYGLTIDHPDVDTIYQWQLGKPEFLHSTDTVPFCVYIRVEDLASHGTISSNLACVAGLADELGEQALDPGESLACEPLPLNCKDQEDGGQFCSPSLVHESGSEGSEGESSNAGPGCACDGGSRGGAGFLVGLAGLTRRRRRSPG